MKAIIQIDVPDHQIGQEVSIYFKDTMMIKGIVQEPSDDLISRDVVLNILEKESHKWGNDYRDWVDAIEEIKNLPSVEQEPCNTDTCKVVKAYMNEWDKTNNSDAISRQAVLEIAKSSKSNWIDNSVLFKRVNELPPVNPQEPIAQERYEDLCEYFGGVEDILKNRDDFKAWLGRVKWHIHKAEELYEKYEQEPKTGHWIDQYNDGNWHCSKCGAIVEKDEQINHNWYFCYHCGCRMVEPQESEDKE